MAIALRGKASKTGTGSTVTVAQADFDTPPQSGDVLVAFGVTATNDTESGSTTVVPPAGWTNRKTGASPTFSMGAVLATRTAGSSEGSYVFTIGGSTQSSVVEILAFSGVDGSTVIDGTVPNMTGTTTTTPAAPACTPAASDSELVCGWAADYFSTGAATWTPPGGMTEDIDTTASQVGLVCTSSIAHKLLSASGSTGTQTGTVSRATPDSTLAASITLKAAATSVPATGRCTGGGTAKATGVRQVAGTGRAAGGGSCLAATVRQVHGAGNATTGGSARAVAVRKVAGTGLASGGGSGIGADTRVVVALGRASGGGSGHVTTARPFVAYTLTPATRVSYTANAREAA